MANERYIVIQEWMLELGLTKPELIAYALIYGFCQDKESNYHGNVEYVAHWCGVQRRQAADILSSLVSKGVVRREERSGKTYRYFITERGDAVNCTPAVDCMGGMQRTARVPLQPSAYDNKVVDNKDIIKDTPSPSAGAREDLLPFGEYVKMTAKDHDRLVARFGAADTARLCEILDGYLSNPKQTNRYRDHYRAILGWPVQRLQEEKLTQQRLDNAKQQQQRIAPNNNGMAYNYGEQAMANARRLEELLKN